MIAAALRKLLDPGLERLAQQPLTFLKGGSLEVVHGGRRKGCCPQKVMLVGGNGVAPPVGLGAGER